MEYSEGFWQALETLLCEHEQVIDRPKGTKHPRYKGLAYPVDYGYLQGTASMDGEGIDVWYGTAGKALTGVVCTVDMVKRDSEVKLLVGCTNAETAQILAFHNQSEWQKGLLVQRK